MSQAFFQPGQHRWREVLGGPELSYKVRHDYTILGHDLEAGTLDMAVRWEGDGGHCPIHRHVSTTTVLVLAGEQHLWDLESREMIVDIPVYEGSEYSEAFAFAAAVLARILRGRGFTTR